MHRDTARKSAAMDEAAFVFDLYQTKLDRAPDDGQMARHLHELLIEGKSRGDIARAVATTATVSGRDRSSALRLPVLDPPRQAYWLAEFFGYGDVEFIHNAYRMIAQRHAEERETADALEGIRRDALLGRLNLLRMLMRSPAAAASGVTVRGLEEITAQEDRAVALDPPPIDFESRTYPLDSLLSFDGERFIIHLYRCVLKREPDETGRQVFSDALASGLRSKAEVASIVACSPEARRVGVSVPGSALMFWKFRFMHAPLVGPLIHWLAVLANLRNIERQLRLMPQAREKGSPNPRIFSALEGAGMRMRLDRIGVASRRGVEIGLSAAVAASVMRDEVSGELQTLREFDLPSIPTGASISPARRRALDGLYLNFEDRFRGTPEDIAERQSLYIERLRTGGVQGQVVVDVGCGRGEWLRLLRQNNFPGHGVDSNTAMVEQCRAAGLMVTLGDGVEYLCSLEGGVAGAVSAFHVVEHLSFLRLLKFLEQARRVLAQGGMLILETPDPANLLVGSNNFYLDPTHFRPIPSPLLQFLVEENGFDQVEVLRLHPMPAYLHAGGGEAAGRLNELCYGAQDYAIIAKKR